MLVTKQNSTRYQSNYKLFFVVMHHVFQIHFHLVCLLPPTRWFNAVSRDYHSLLHLVSFYVYLLSKFVDFIWQAHIPEPDFRSTDGEEVRAMLKRLYGECGFPEICTPNVESCNCAECNKPWAAATERTAVIQQSFIFDLKGVILVTVMERVCSCGGILGYDGKSDAILNLDNINLFSHELLRGWVYIFGFQFTVLFSNFQLNTLAVGASLNAK